MRKGALFARRAQPFHTAMPCAARARPRLAAVEWCTAAN